MATKTYLDFTGLTLYTELLKQYISITTPKILYDTKAHWDAQPSLLSEAGTVYIYSDYYQDDENNDIPAFKVGDSNTYLIDMPVMGKLYDDHLADSVRHITNAERTAWNNKVRIYEDPTDSENIVFTTN